MEAVLGMAACKEEGLAGVAAMAAAVGSDAGAGVPAGLEEDDAASCGGLTVLATEAVAEATPADAADGASAADGAGAALVVGGPPNRAVRLLAALLLGTPGASVASDLLADGPLEVPKLAISSA